MNFRVSFNVDNEAFADDMNMAVSDVLFELARRVANYEVGVDKPLAIRDINGNTTGVAEYTNVRKR